MKLQIAKTSFNRKRAKQVFVKAVPNMMQVVVLTEANRREVLEFLAKRPVHTVVMTSFIQDNGFESENNRGKFYGYRGANGKLEGIALIGHTTLIESRSEDALAAFAFIARAPETPLHLLMSSGKTTEKFWQYLNGGNGQPRLVCTEILFELAFPFAVQNCEWEIRLAKAEELQQIAEAHAEVAFMESGVDPLLKDRAGFLKRTLRRIEQKRTFVVFDNGKLVFKADIAAETAETIYLEGIYVAPECRGRGTGSKCLSNLSLQLLNRVQNICLLSNVEFANAHRSFQKAGLKKTDRCQTIFV